MGFHKPLLRPAISGGGTWPGGGLVDRPRCSEEKKTTKVKVYVKVVHRLYLGFLRAPTCEQ